MVFITAKKGTRPSEPKIYIAEKAKTMTFSAGFFRTHDIKLANENYVRLAFDVSTKEIALEFSALKRNDEEYLRLTLAQSKTSATCSVNPILATFSIDIKKIAGTYKDDAISGPVKINGFSDQGFILRTRSREM